MMAAILNSAISWIQPFSTKKISLIHSDSNDDGSHHEFCHAGFRYCHLGFRWLNLTMAAILNSAMLDSDTAILDSDTLLSSLRFTQKHSHSILTLTQTNSIWLKLIHSHLIWWWQPSWTPARLDSDTAILDSDTLLSSLRFTLKYYHSILILTQTNSIWLKLIHSHLTWWW